MPLTAKQRLFVDEYMLDLNITQAALRAGYSQTSAKSAHIMTPVVKAEIERCLAERSLKLEIDQNRVLLEISRLAFNDPRLAFAANGSLLPVHAWPDEVAAAISSIKIHELKNSQGEIIGECKEIRFWDKGKQLELAARHLGMLKDKLEISTPIAEMLKAARERIRHS
jgi:phage terminase small subunit